MESFLSTLFSQALNDLRRLLHSPKQDTPLRTSDSFFLILASDFFLTLAIGLVCMSQHWKTRLARPVFARPQAPIDATSISALDKTRFIQEILEQAEAENTDSVISNIIPPAQEVDFPT